jgi:hypothetical protein
VSATRDQRSSPRVTERSERGDGRAAQIPARIVERTLRHLDELAAAE